MKDKLGITQLGGLEHSQEKLISGQCDVHNLMSTALEFLAPSSWTKYKAITANKKLRKVRPEIA
jgi:hypothetical protein